MLEKKLLWEIRSRLMMHPLVLEDIVDFAIMEISLDEGSTDFTNTIEIIAFERAVMKGTKGYGPDDPGWRHLSNFKKPESDKPLNIQPDRPIIEWLINVLEPYDPVYKNEKP